MKVFTVLFIFALLIYSLLTQHEAGIWTGEQTGMFLVAVGVGTVFTIEGLRQQ